MNFTLEQAITLLRNAVKDSHLENQKHIDLTLIDALDRKKYENALVFVNRQVIEGKLTKEELKQRLGLVS